MGEAMTFWLWCLFALGLGMLCLILVRAVLEWTDKRKPTLTWVWMNRK
jgi:hypothetical protein